MGNKVRAQKRGRGSFSNREGDHRHNHRRNSNSRLLRLASDVWAAEAVAEPASLLRYCKVLRLVDLPGDPGDVDQIAFVGIAEARILPRRVVENEDAGREFENDETRRRKPGSAGAVLLSSQLEYRGYQSARDLEGQGVSDVEERKLFNCRKSVLVEVQIVTNVRTNDCLCYHPVSEEFDG